MKNRTERIFTIKIIADKDIQNMSDVIAGRVYSLDGVVSVDVSPHGAPQILPEKSLEYINYKAHALAAEAGALEVVLTIEHKKNLSMAGGYSVIDVRPERLPS